MRLRQRGIGSSSAGLRDRRLLVCLSALFLGYLAWVVVEPTGSTSSIARWLYNIVVVGAALVCLKSPHIRGPERRAWLCLGVTLLLWAAGDSYYTLFVADERVVPPTVTDWLWLASYPFLYAAVGLLVRARTAYFERSLWLDALVAALAVGAVGAAVLFRAVVETTGGSPRMVLMHLAYPLADLLLLGLVVAVLAITGWKLDRAWLCIVAATVVLALADAAFLYQAAVGAEGTWTILDAGWLLAIVLLAAAAWQPARGLGSVRVDGARLLFVPAAFGATALALLVYGQFEPLNTAAVVLAATSIVAVIARMAFTFREKMFLLAASRVEARTDALTGIGNRRKLLTDLAERLESRRPTVLLLLDLDGFKGYNDAFGHPAGDALLARLAKNLTVVVRDHGEAYRMGGDEFCVLASVGAARADVLAAAAATALEERGDGFRITAAHGAVALPDEAVEVSEALRLADARMYDEKDGRRASAGRQSRDVLLRALYERDARLQGHLAELVELVRKVGTSLALPAAELQELTLAAELHEVGKLAIPDSILRKAEPLTDDEWQFVRRHPLIGERILSSAPALAPIAKVVRSIRERMDGQGYPDGLSGEQIPLAARIIGACAAFIQLTTEQPGRAPLAADDAVDALRRAAGTELDADVVDVVVAHAYDDVREQLAVA